VLHVGSSKRLILKAEKVPRINDRVVDENLKFVGVVFDVFGPVASPYVVVEPSVDEPEPLVNRVLYVFPSKSRRRREKRK
jgi:RNA-binding protein